MLFDHLPRALDMLRRSRGLTIAQLAKRSGMSVSQLQGYEEGSSTPRLETLERLLDALEASDLGLAIALRTASPEGDFERESLAAVLPDTLDTEAVAHLSEALRHLGSFLQLAGLKILPLTVPASHSTRAESPDADWSIASSRSA